jgi:5-methylthioribose kinase
LACLLARVLGKSPLEYLGSDEAQRQSDVVLELMEHPPEQVSGLIDKFLQQIEAHGKN